jgi:hypothetical protein
VNPIGGISLYDKDEFTNQGIELKFLKTKDITYSQSGKQFIPNLSVLDVLMCNGVEKAKKFLDCYDLELPQYGRNQEPTATY